MNDWDVSGITDFSGLFVGELEYFNEPIGNWDVSSATDFVSIDQGVRFNSIEPFVWLCFQVLDSESNPLMMCGFGRNMLSQPKLYFIHYSLMLEWHVLWGLCL
jgi:hypothetical protein